MKLPGVTAGNDPRNQAFTRVDLIAVVFVLCLVAAIANPLLTSHSRTRSDTLVCQANLSQIGRAYQLWGNDHEDLPPFLVPQEQGGLRGHPLRVNPYIQFSWVSNGLVSPKVFACPADTNTTRRAKDFSANPDGGLLHPNYRNNAVSYMISFHAQRFVPRSILSGDRNFEPPRFGGCSYAGLQQIFSVEAQFSGWSQAIHWTKGNLLFNDGSVEETSTAQLRTAVRSTDEDDFAGAIHVVLPK